MAIFDDIDGGVYAPWNAPVQTWAGPQGGQAIKSISVEGFQEIHVARGGIARTRTETVWLIPPAIGGAPAGSINAALFLFRQLYELVNNPKRQPCLIRWRSGGGVEVADSEDGWYIITDLKPNMEFIWNGNIPVTITAIYLGPLTYSRISMATLGGQLSDNFSGSALNFAAFPLGSTPLEISFNRVGAEGNIPCVISPSNTSPFIPSATIVNLFKGGVRCYDTINTGTNAVPTTTFINANWVEVKGTEHNFQGDCVLTNGLAMIVYKPSTACSLYLWMTFPGSPTWVRWADLGFIDSSAGLGVVPQTFSLSQISLDECILIGLFNTTIGLAELTIHLLRGRLDITIDYFAKNDTGAGQSGPLLFNFPQVGPKIAFNSSFIADNATPPSEAGPGVATDLGYGAGMIADTNFSYIFGFLYQNQPTTKMPQIYGTAAKSMTSGDTGMVLGSIRTFGVFAAQYAATGLYNTSLLQQEMESVTLSGGFASAADALASNGNAAKLPATTAVGAIAVQASWQPAVGTYDVWARVRVSANASATAQMQIGLYDVTAGAFLGSTTYAPSDFLTTYRWVKVASNVTTVSGHNHALRVISVTNAAVPDWFVDEMFLAPKTINADKSGPQDIWQQFDYDRDLRMVRQ